MPVFFKVQDHILSVTVDGDFTAGELERKGREALDGESMPAWVCVLLDMSGAAGSHTTNILELARVFVEHPTRVPRIAVLGSEASTEAEGVEIQGFHRRAEALEWLNG